MQYVVITQSLLHDSRWVNCGEADVGRYAISDQRPKRDSISIEEATVSSRLLKKSLFSPAQAWCAKTHLSPSFVLASFRPSTGTQPPHHSAARTDLVLLIRRTVRPRGYDSAPHSLQPCWTAFLSILRAHIPLLALVHSHRRFSSPLSTRSHSHSVTYN